MSTSSQISDKGNYPPPGDTTSEGGYGGQGIQAFAPVSQRGLVDQTTDGQPLGDELEDAYQGTDEVATRNFRQEQQQQQKSHNFSGGSQGQTLTPYGESLETREEAIARLAAGATDLRARTYQGEIPRSEADKQ